MIHLGPKSLFKSVDHFGSTAFCTGTIIPDWYVVVLTVCSTAELHGNSESNSGWYFNHRHRQYFNFTYPAIQAIHIIPNTQHFTEKTCPLHKLVNQPHRSQLRLEIFRGIFYVSDLAHRHVFHALYFSLPFVVIFKLPKSENFSNFF